MKRILILGPSGSGKTSLAKKLSEKLKIPCYDLDDIFWLRKYDKKRNEKSCEKILAKLSGKNDWIIEGAYSQWIVPAVKRCEIVILLNISFSVLLKRLVNRYLARRKFKKDDLKDFLALIKYAYSYKRRGQNAGYHKHIELIGKHKKEFIHIRNNSELKKFIKTYKSL